MRVRPRMRKAIATHTLVLVIMMGFFAVIAFYFLGGSVSNTGKQATRAGCTFKRLSYCTDWRGNNYDQPPWSWSSRNPEGCERLSPPITKPQMMQDCEDMFS
jgi:hypothetical protein